MLTTAQWQAYKNIINDVHDSFNQDTVTWHRFTKGLQRYGEDDITKDTYTDIPLKCLISYNIFRTWPMTAETPSGGVDKENIVMILNKNYLSENGYLNSSGFFALDPGKDFFIHMGLTYRSAGETPVAQAGDENLLFYVILSREETPTGTEKY